MESQFGWRFEVEIRRWLLTNNSSLKWSLKTASPMMKPPKFSLVRSDTVTNHVHLSSSLVLSDALSEVFRRLTVDTPNEYVENLLQLFWALTPKTSGTELLQCVCFFFEIQIFVRFLGKKRIDQDFSASEFPHLSLSDVAVERFLNWLIESLVVSERVWTLSLKTLSFCTQNNVRFFVKF